MALPRGKCPDCGADVALRRSGRVREHRGNASRATGSPSPMQARICSGSGKPPAPASKAYIGKRTPNGLTVTVSSGKGLHRLAHHVRHSPTGFECGYSGSGPADLARCILIDFLGDQSICGSCDDGEIATDEGPETCWDCGGEVFKLPVSYQEFKFQVVAQLARDGFVLTGEEVADWVEGHRG